MCFVLIVLPCRWYTSTGFPVMLLAFSNALIHSLQSERVNRSSNRQLSMRIRLTLLWRHNGRDSVSNHQPHDCLLNRLFRRRSKKTSKLRVTGLCVGNSPGTGEFPAQKASNAENVFIWWRHHDYLNGRIHDGNSIFRRCFSPPFQMFRMLFHEVNVFESSIYQGWQREEQFKISFFTTQWWTYTKHKKVMNI